MSLVNATTTFGYSPTAAYSLNADPKGTFGYGIGSAIKRVWDWAFGVQESSDRKEAVSRSFSLSSANTSVPFSTYYGQLFAQKTLSTFYVEQDAVVDDVVALSLLLAAQKAASDLPNGKNVIALGVNPSAGFVVRTQAEFNTLQFIELTQSQNVPVYPGARAPLAMGNNTEAIKKLEQQINTTHYFGHDGLQDVGGGPNVTITTQATPGAVAAASAIIQATPDNRVTLVSSGPLTELAETLTGLVTSDPEGTFAKNINAIVIQGGCLTPGVGCNAPYFKPDDKKDSELSFFFDVPAVQDVFEICQHYGIPIILSELGLTRQSGLLWTKEQVSALQKIDNDITAQLAKITNQIPYPYARQFPANTYPMDALIGIAATFWPELFDATRVALTIGDVGQMTVNETVPEAEQNVYILSMSPENQAIFYDTILKEYEIFTCLPGTTSDKCGHAMPLSTLLEILIPAGVVAMGLAALIIFAIVRSKREKARLQKNNQKLQERVGKLQQATSLGATDSTGKLLPAASERDPLLLSSDEEK